MGRQQLLDDTVEHVRRHGVAGASLRQIADAIGTSHRMLIYHFGSREGLLVAAVQQIEEDERAAVTRLAERTPARDLLPAVWKRLASPARANEERLFFEMYGQALQGTPGAADLLAGIVQTWVDATVEIGAQAGFDRTALEAQARLDLAVLRGLLLDLLATGERRRVDAAFTAYLATRRPPPRVGRRASRAVEAS